MEKAEKGSKTAINGTKVAVKAPLGGIKATKSAGKAPVVPKPRNKAGQVRPQTDASRPKPQPAKPPGRPSYVVCDADRNKIMSALAIGGNQKQIALLLGIAQKTLIKHYRKELDAGYEMAKLEMGTVAYEAAMRARKDNRFIGALTHYENTRFGYKQQQGVDHTSSDGSMATKAPILLMPE